MTAPVLVASTDGVGTKTMVAARLNRWNTIGQDLVNHCLNDILVQGATPLFFLDYVASAKLDPHTIATVVQGVAAACQASGCALLGGETAEMPGVYQPSELDLVGTVVGVVEKQTALALNGSRIGPGDVLLGLPSTGLHTNGYSLARKIFANDDWHSPHPQLSHSLGEALLAVHRAYGPEVSLLQNKGLDLRGLAHITGGGLLDNLPRSLPAETQAIIAKNSWPRPLIFDLLKTQGQLEEAEMFRAFNMGIGFVIILPAAQAETAQSLLPESYRIGHIASRPTETAPQVVLR
jgi:phosphoribosylformylglycinamidine cyclo-ligase